MTADPRIPDLTIAGEPDRPDITLSPADVDRVAELIVEQPGPTPAMVALFAESSDDDAALSERAPSADLRWLHSSLPGGDE